MPFSKLKHPRLNLQSSSNDQPGKNPSGRPVDHVTRKLAAAANSSSATVNGNNDNKNAMRLLSESEEDLRKEEEILSLLTVLSGPVMNDELPATLQAVKAHLYARNYAAAFGQQDYLRAYAARWVPGRALAYRSLFLNIPPLVEQCQRRGRQGEITQVLCIGGGAGSEVIALASLTNHFAEYKIKMKVSTIDVAEWGEILSEMNGLVKTRWEVGDDHFTSNFECSDILETYQNLPFQSQDIITCLFTTNELFSSSRIKTMALLAHLSQVCKKGALLVFAESTGSYSEVQVGERTYPLELILDQTLANSRPGQSAKWKIVTEEQGVWYRVPEESKSKYQLQLENTHMLVRVYRKL